MGEGWPQGTCETARILPLSGEVRHAAALALSSYSVLLLHLNHLMDLNEPEFLEVRHISVQIPCDVTHLCDRLPAGQSKTRTEVAGLGLGSWIRVMQ